MLGKRRTFGNLATFFPERGTARCPNGWAASSTLAHLEGRCLGARTLAGKARSLKGILDAEDARAGASPPASTRIDRVESRRTAARRRHVDHRRAAARRRCRAGRCEVLLDGGITCGPGRAQGAGAGRARLPHRQGVSLWSRGARRSEACHSRWRSSAANSKISMALMRRAATCATSGPRSCAELPDAQCASALSTQPAAVSSPSTSLMRAIATSDARQILSETGATCAGPRPASRAARQVRRCRRA